MRAGATCSVDPCSLCGGMSHGHSHRWCSQICKDGKCEWGPCCVTEANSCEYQQVRIV